jgi:hypothetical protein
VSARRLRSLDDVDINYSASEMTVYYKKLISEIKAEFPKFEIIPKTESVLMKTLDMAMRAFSFGCIRTFMSHYTTTLGYKIYIPTLWDRMDAVAILRHERVHMRQYRRFGRVWFLISYLLLPFPVLFAYCRLKYEQEAYEETIKADFEQFGIECVSTSAYRRLMIQNFTSPQYCWTWVLRRTVEKWFERVLNGLEH